MVTTDRFAETMFLEGYHAVFTGIGRIAGLLMGKILVFLHFPPARRNTHPRKFSYRTSGKTVRSFPRCGFVRTTATWMHAWMATPPSRATCEPCETSTVVNSTLSLRLDENITYSHHIAVIAYPP